MTIYSTGTVSVTNGDAVVTGSGTAWAVALIAGGIFSSAGMSVPILSVDSDTSLTLAYDWPGTTATGAVYAIARENSEAADIVDLNDRLSRVLVTLSLAGITPNASGTIAERDALTLAVGDKGFLFLHAEPGVDFEFYRWSGSSWDGPFATRGPAGLGTGGTIEGLVHAAAGKTTPVDADEMALVDSAASFGLKKLTWANLKGGIWAAWGALINGGTAKTTPVDADLFAIADSAASNATKKLTWANLKATLKAYTDTLYQPVAAALTSWAGVSRASGFDTFAGTPTSANLRSLLSDETGTGSAVFSTNPAFVDGISVTSANAFSPQVYVRNSTNDANGAYVQIRKSRGTTNTAVQVGDALGTFMFQGYDSTATPVLQNSAYLAAIAETVTSGSVKARFELVAGVSNWQFFSSGTTNVPGDIQRAGTKILGARDTGWTAMTGTSDKATSYATGTVTLAQLAGRVMAMQAALTTHGIIGA